MTMGITSPTSTTGQILKNGSAVISFDANNNATFAGNVAPTVNSTFRNRIINGAMVIDQRNAGASKTIATTATYVLDRWNNYVSQASKYSVQQNAGSVTPPAGYNYYLGATSLSSYSVTSGDFFLVSQSIEGYNVADLAWGTASAKTITLSFWVRSSLTGTFSVSIQNSGQSKSYPATYTISSANTWEQKTITIPGPTDGSWDTTNGNGLWLFFGLGGTGTYTGPAGAWASANYTQASGCVSVVGTNGATWYITGVQLEAGSVATPFEQRLYGTELALCQRYYQKIKPTSGSETIEAWSMICLSATSASLWYPFPVTMRSAPTGSYTGTVNTDFQVYSAGSYRTLSSGPNLSPSTPYGSRIDFNSASTFTSGYSAGLYLQTTSASISFSAEL